MLSLRGVSKWFGSRKVLSNVTLTIARGERVAVIGDNGSGKSTLLQLAAGVIEPTDGELRLTERPAGYAPEKPDMPDHLLAGEWLDVIASLRGAPWRDMLGVRALAGRKIGTLSLGQRQRVSLAAAFIGDPPMWVLDEPTNALDPDVRDAVIDELRAGTWLVATHDHELARRVATRVLTMRDGVLI